MPALLGPCKLTESKIRKEQVGHGGCCRAWLSRRLRQIIAQTYFREAEALSAETTREWQFAAMPLQPPHRNIQDGCRLRRSHQPIDIGTRLGLLNVELNNTADQRHLHRTALP